MSYQPIPDEDPFEDQSQAHWQTLPANPVHRDTTPTPSAPPSTSSSSRPALPSAPPAPSAQHHEASDVVTPLVPEDAPPSYEVAVAKDIPQIHDNYDHLRGPRAVRGIEDKTRIPLDSTPYFEGGGSSSGGGGVGSSSSGAGSSSANIGPSAPRIGSPAYGSFHQQQQQQQQQELHRQLPHQQHQPPSTSMVQPSAPALPELGRRGQIALGPDSPVEGVRRGHGQDAEVHSTFSDDSEEHDDSCWSTVAEPRPWFALLYHIFFILPWAIFCQVWVLCVGITSFVSLIFPPIGYLLIIPSVTSWRALARVDLEMSALLVSDEVRRRYGAHRVKHPVFIAPEPVSSSPWHMNIFGVHVSLPTSLHAWRQRRTQRRARSMWKRGVKHLKETINDKHTTKSFFYFVVGKFMIALFIFVVIVVFFSLSIPFMLCLLPSLLKLSTTFANMQYRWALTWLTEKSNPVVLAAHDQEV
ncbi:hypothetical protein DFQ26_004594 [Actinomortierella ambigua]|nr:hypothetical protein DFQ26_004594 [Actinomortierella ambigua]